VKRVLGRRVQAQVRRAASAVSNQQPQAGERSSVSFEPAPQLTRDRGDSHDLAVRGPQMRKCCAVLHVIRQEEKSNLTEQRERERERERERGAGRSIYCVQYTAPVKFVSIMRCTTAGQFSSATAA
jgi:hypothetical protein